MATLATLRKQAKGMGIAASVIRGATNADELEQIIADHSDGNGSKGKSKAKAAVKKATKGKGKAKTGKAKSKTTEDDEKPKRGRPKGSKNSTTKAKATTKAKGNSKAKSASSKSAPAGKSNKGKAKRQTTAKNDDAGRFMLGDIDFSETDGWNPREDSVPDVIIRLAKKYRGNREKVFDAMVEDLWDYVAKKKQNGDRRSKAEAEKMLAYRISQTIWRFAIATGQHEASENRIEYGTGEHASGNSKKAKPKAKTTKGKATKDTPKRGRPKGSTSKAKETPKRGRGRPKGSTNKPKATAGKRGRPKGSKNKK